MKKLVSIVLTVVLGMALICTAATGEEAAQPEGGKKFETDWAIQDAVISVYYEEEGYRVSIDSFSDEGKGIEWFYNCYYHEEDDTLVSVSSSKQAFVFDPEDPDERSYEAADYEGFDDEGMESIFSIDGKGCLIWKDGHENMGQDLEFINIGRFDGDWKNDAEGVFVSFFWDGQEDRFCYDVIILRSSADSEDFTLFIMTGVYNSETGKLECTGTATEYRMNADGDFDFTEDGETYEAFFSRMENGGILFETANGIELEEDLDDLD